MRAQLGRSLRGALSEDRTATITGVTRLLTSFVLAMPKLPKLFINNLELWLNAAGIVVVFAVAALAPGTADLWQIAAVTALGVSVLHGLIFWTVRRRQRMIRHRSIMEIREMLTDVVQNHLAIIAMALPPSEEYQMEVEIMKESIAEITHQVGGLSEEQLSEWKSHYREAVANATEIEYA